MDYDADKLDEMVLALLYLTGFEDEYGMQAWKNLPWEALDRLHEKGYISNPKNKAKSVTLSEEGAKLSEELFIRHFGGKR